jgi:hypothetical protein
LGSAIDYCSCLSKPLRVVSIVEASVEDPDEDVNNMWGHEAKHVIGDAVGARGFVELEFANHPEYL